MVISIAKNILHCNMIMNKEKNIYIKYQDIQSQMMYYNIAHMIIQIISILFSLFLLFENLLLPLMISIAGTYSPSYKTYSDPLSIDPIEENPSYWRQLCKMHKKKQVYYKKSMEINKEKPSDWISYSTLNRFIIEYMSEPFILVAYMYLLRETIVVILCCLAIVSLYKEIKTDNINRIPKVIDITENIINIVLSLILIKILFMQAYRDYFDIYKDRYYGKSFFITVLLIRVLIKIVFNVIYGQSGVKVKKPPEQISINQ